MPEVGIITEVGDLGCGYDPLSEEDQKLYQEAEEVNNRNKDDNNK